MREPSTPRTLELSMPPTSKDYLFTGEFPLSDRIILLIIFDNFTIITRLGIRRFIKVHSIIKL
jgi:hypothetical protein